MDGETTLLGTESVSDTTPVQEAAAPEVQTPATETTQVTDGEQPQQEVKLPGWTAGLKAEQKANEYFSKFTKVSEFAEEHLKLKEQLDKSIKLPDDQASPEDRDEFYRKLGRPEKPEDYKLPTNIGKYTIPQQFAKEMQNMAFELGLTGQQAVGFYKAQVQKYHENMSQAVDRYRTEMVEGERALKKEWGKDFEVNLDVARRGYLSFADKDISKLLNDMGIANNPAVLKFFHRVGQKILGDKQVPGTAPTPAKSEYVVSYKPMN